MRLAKPTFPAPDHDHGRCTADALRHAERVCAVRAQKLTPIRRQVLETLLSSHRPLGAYEVIEELARSMPRPAPITVYRALDFLMENGLVHRIESRNAFLACAHDHDATAMVAFLICDHCGSVGEIPAARRPVRHATARPRCSGRDRDRGREKLALSASFPMNVAFGGVIPNPVRPLSRFPTNRILGVAMSSGQP